MGENTKIEAQSHKTNGKGKAAQEVCWAEME